MKILNSSISLLAALTFLALAKSQAETSIVPPGVRAFVYHHYNAEVNGHIGPNGIEKSLNMNERISANVVGQAVPTAQTVIDRLQKNDPELLNSLDLGTVNLKPDVRVKVDVFGGAFGVSKDFMLVTVVPYYTASTKLAGSFESTNSFKSAASRLRSASITSTGATPTELNAFAQVLEQLAAPNGANAQDIIMNSLGYKPIGNWEGSGIGDIMFYGQVRPINGSLYKQGFKLGAEVPTGRTDDPDNLIDVPFGKGHFVTFLESLNDFYVLNDLWIVAANLKFAYQWAHYPTYRLVPDDGVPLTSVKEQVYRKPGDYGVMDLHSEIKIFGDLYFHSDYIYTVKGRDKFSGARGDYNYSWLEKDTDQESQVAELGFNFTTVNLFMNKQFPIPFKLGTFYSKVIGGRNVDKVDLTALRFEMYF